MTQSDQLIQLHEKLHSRYQAIYESEQFGVRAFWFGQYYVIHLVEFLDEGREREHLFRNDTLEDLWVGMQEYAPFGEWEFFAY